jgi:hypothetical protein
VRAGEGAKYAGDGTADGMELQFDRLVFSNRDGVRTVIPFTGSAPGGVRKGKDAGTCKPGQTAATTGCTPVSEGGKSPPTTSPQKKPPTSGGKENGRQHLTYSHFNEGVRKLESAKDTLTRFGKAGYEKLGPPAKNALMRTWGAARYVEHKLSVGFRNSKELAERVARERGWDEGGAKRLSRCLGIADMVAAWTINMPATLAVTGSVTLAKASSWVPIASLGYIGYSTARNPFAVLRAAKASLKSAGEHKGYGAEDFVKDLADALERCDDKDLFMALYCAALDESPRDAGRALDLAVRVYDGGVAVDSNGGLTEEDVRVVALPEPSNRPEDRLG